MSKRLPKKVRELLNKSKESCLLAVEVYNKPQTSFKSGAYIVLMVIAYTSLFHAIFERNHIKYYYKEKTGDTRRYKRIDGEKVAWELNTCVKEYFKDKNYDINPIKANINLFIKLRNKVEHRFMPDLDNFILGECQSLLTNYENILMEEFGEDEEINENLAFPLQFKNIKYKNPKYIPPKDFEAIKGLIIDYRNDLPSDVSSSSCFRFKAVLINVNNRNQADYAIDFIQEKDLNSEQLKSLENLISITKEKTVYTNDFYKFKSTDVCERVRRELSKVYGCKIKFGIYHNNVMCKEYKIYPLNGKGKVNKRFCLFNVMYGKYEYSQEWIDFLIKKLSNKLEFLRLFPAQQFELLNLLNTNDVCKKVRRELSQFYGFKIKFNTQFHLKLYIRFGIRPKNDINPNPNEIDETYCRFIKKGTYAYTQEWVNLLVTKLSYEDYYLELFPNQKELFKKEKDNLNNIY